MQYGVAATVAAAMVLGVQSLNQQPVEQGFSTAKVPVIPGVGGGMSPVSLDSSRHLASSESDEVKQRRRLNLTARSQREFETASCYIF